MYHPLAATAPGERQRELLVTARAVHLWGTDYVADGNVVDRHIRNLRAKLQNDWRRPRYVATVPGRGFRFLPGDAEAQPTQERAEPPTP